MSPKKRKHILIEAMALGFIPCGLREFTMHIGQGIADRAPMLKEKYGLTFEFLVPKEFDGVFGQEVNYCSIPKCVRFAPMVLPLVDCDIYHTLHQLCFFKWLKGKHHALMTVHDINFRHTRHGKKRFHAAHRFAGRLNHADSLVYITDFVRRDVGEMFPNNKPSRLIYNGVTDLLDIFKEPATPGFASLIPEQFLFHLSSLDAYKNPDALLEMMRYLPEETLVITGRWEKDPQLRELAESMPNVIALDPVTEEEKAWLYKHCRAFLFPSSAEGFGLPPVEAMKMGKPVFLSTSTSLPEVGGRAAYYWSVIEPKAMAEVVKKKLSKPADTDAILANAARFDWDKCVDDYIDCYLDILGRE